MQAESELFHFPLPFLGLEHAWLGGRTGVCWAQLERVHKLVVRDS